MSYIANGGATPGTNNVGYLNIPILEKSANYTTILTDSGKCILHPASDANARTFTIDSNANVAYPVGTVLMFKNNSANNLTIAITSDTLTLDGTGTTGSRTLAQYGKATAIKETSTSWSIGGVGLTDPTPPVTYATWNPADKNAYISTSNGDLTATAVISGGGQYGTIRSTVGVSSGKWYWEQTHSEVSSGAWFDGISTTSAYGSQELGSDGYGWGVRFAPTLESYARKHNGAYTTGVCPSGQSSSTIYGYALDMDSGTLSAYIDGVSQGTIFSGISGTVFATSNIWNNGAYSTANFGATPFAYTPPVGFNAGLYA